MSERMMDKINNTIDVRLENLSSSIFEMNETFVEILKVLELIESRMEEPKAKTVKKK
jgi:hypothetical protein